MDALLFSKLVFHHAGQLRRWRLAFLAILFVAPIPLLGAGQHHSRSVRQSTGLLAGQFETANFVVQNAPSHDLARRFCETAEKNRRELALFWLGKVLPDWSEKCPIQVRVGQIGAGGATTFIFQGGEVFGWEMDIQGSTERIIDSVLPHEITHMILASHFRKPVPRWIDEGAATFVEHPAERENYRRMLLGFLQRNQDRGVPFNEMVAMKEYPEDVMPFYAQGFSVVEYLIALRGPRELVRFTSSGIGTGDWNVAVQKHYGSDNASQDSTHGFERLGDLQQSWTHWVAAGFPAMERLAPTPSVADALPAYAHSPYGSSPYVQAVSHQSSESVLAGVADKTAVVQTKGESYATVTEIVIDGWKPADSNFSESHPSIMVDAAKIPFSQ